MWATALRVQVEKDGPYFGGNEYNEKFKAEVRAMLAVQEQT